VLGRGRRSILLGGVCAGCVAIALLATGLRSGSHRLDPRAARSTFATIRDGRLYLIDGDNGNPRSLDMAAPASLTWSPDGRRFTFIGRKSERVEVATLAPRADKVRVKRLEVPYGAIWSSDDRLLYSSRRRKGRCGGAGDCYEASRLIVSSVDGAARRAITSYGCIGDAAWSPDGQTIAFRAQTHRAGLRASTPDCFADGAENEEVVLIGRDGTGARVVAHRTLGYGFDEIEWSPDGRMLLANTGRLLRIRADGTGKHVVPHTSNAAYGGNPTAQAEWSPDGKRIFYIATHHRGCSGSCDHMALFVINVDGSGKRNVTPTLGKHEKVVWFAVSPDDHHVAFVTGDGNVRNLYLVDVDGRTHTEVPNPKRRETGDLEWSPDGSVLAFVRDDVYLVNADGSALTRVGDATEDGDLLGWRP
jgi:Tol biopolymer transport system component